MLTNNLRSKTIHFRLAEPEDAIFIYTLRNNEKFNQHLSPTSGGVDQQRSWLIDYKKREQISKEFYFIIVRNDNNEKIGTVRLYDFLGDKKSFCWGSWILNENKTRSSALESALLVYLFAFEEMSFKESHFDVRVNNKKVAEFHEKLGAIETSRNDLDIFFVFKKDSFESIKNNFSKYLVQ
ncbi:GNAT family N-acetyltransferase [Enterobacteriaceae bacterium H16N7]|nr:GNAT family N-acetyltransferase [Dryocola clanedunensis]